LIFDEAKIPKGKQERTPSKKGARTRLPMDVAVTLAGALLQMLYAVVCTVANSGFLSRHEMSNSDATAPIELNII
jgi:hypothetical protein